jgi:RNA polymerase sigma-70 factor (ECF subfamily)
MAPGLENSLLITRLKKDDDAAFQALYQQHHQAVFANIFRLVSRQEEAEDILQEVFLSLWESRHKLSDNHSVAGWLFTTSYYKACAYLKQSLRKKVFPLPEGVHDIAEEQAETEGKFAEQTSMLNTAIELLPPRKRTAFRLCRIEGKSYEEAAVILGISIDSVKDYVKTSSIFIRKYVVSEDAAASLVSLCLLTVYLQI